MNIIYMGTPDFAVPTLEALINSEHDVKLVVTQPDKAKGRKKELVPPPVKETALKYGIDVYQPEIIKNENLDMLKKYDPDVIIVVAYGQILSKEILDLPKYGCLNVHASLLPAWRGAAPIQWSILNGDSETGVTIMQMDEGLDTGDILYVEKYKLKDDETGGSLFDTLSEMGGPAILKVLDDAIEGRLSPVKQGESTTPYAKMLNKEMGRLDFSKSAEELERTVRGLSPWPGTFTFFEGKQLKIWKTEVLSEEEVKSLVLPDSFIENAECSVIAGVSKDEFFIKTAEGYLGVDEVQLAGKKRMDTGSFLRGVHEVLGVKLTNDQ